MWLAIAIACGYVLVMVPTRSFMGRFTDEVLRESRQTPSNVNIAMWFFAVVWPIVWLYLAVNEVAALLFRRRS